MNTGILVVIFSIAVFTYAKPAGEQVQLTNVVETGIFEKCIDDLGCFNNSPPFYHPVYRPIALLPQNRFETKFWLFTQQNLNDQYLLELNSESLWKSNFDPSLETIFIIHGYTSRLEEGDWKYRMKDALLNFAKYNVLLVDWTDSNGPPYPQAVANGRVVGAQIAQLIQFLQNERGIKSQSVHLIGHSLGSHVAGWAGERINALGRITGLDPAGPYFQKAENIVRLDPSDAEFVDVIHTNGGTNFLDGLGIADPIGHLDFYPNGGTQQPGCPLRSIYGDSSNILADNATLPLGGSSSCSHGRAPELFISSIISREQCSFKAIDCEDIDICQMSLTPRNARVAKMGFFSRKIPGLKPGHKFYLLTTDRPPYCIASRGSPVQSSG